MQLRRRQTRGRRGSASRSWSTDDRLRFDRQQALALQLLAGELPRATDSLSFLARPLFGRLLVMSAKLHFAEDSLPLHLLLKGLQGLINIVVANEYLLGPSYVLRPSLEVLKIASTATAPLLEASA